MTHPIRLRHVSTARLRPVDWLHRLVLAGLQVAVIVAGVAAAYQTIELKRDCHGAFSRGFSAAFDRYHCDPVLKFKGGIELRVPLPLL